MAQISPEFVERYQVEYRKNPQSRIFAPLAEAYRQMGLLDEALRIAEAGVKIHPGFAGGRVAYARILIDMKQPEKALAQLSQAVQASPDNLLGHTLMGETLLEMRQPKEALKAFKMVLFLNPGDEKARAMVRKWEFLSADDYEDDLFQMRPVFSLKKSASPVKDEARKAKALERALSLADAFTVRGELERASITLKDAREELGDSDEIVSRLELLARRTQMIEDDDEDDEIIVHDPTEPDDGTMADSMPDHPMDRRRARLETFLRRISERRMGG